ncbi:MAG: sensor domain-containing diguanylate cyclase [Capsulimonadaceae bacterium]|nr:sensor domain-containing diguanylate cyclase [Capsulimonadaceae bacterium]
MVTESYMPEEERDRLDTLGRYLVLGVGSEQTYDEVARLAAHICDAPIGIISLIGPEKVWFKSHLGIHVTDTPRENWICSQIIARPPVSLVVEDAAFDTRFARHPLVADEPHLRFYAGAPLLAADHRVLGALAVADTRPRFIGLSELVALEALSRQVVTLMDLKIKEGQLHLVSENLVKLASTDGLTGLNNHRAFQESIRAEFEHGHANKRPLSVARINIDLFKDYNDKYGYACGDLVLKTVAEILRRSARPGDTIARFSGEEFAVIMPDSSGKEAVDAVERIRARVDGHGWTHRQVTVSIGVTTSTVTTPDADHLIVEAGLALYNAKEHGRNFVRHFSALSLQRLDLAA